MKKKEGHFNVSLKFIILLLFLIGCNNPETQSQTNDTSKADTLITRFVNPDKLHITNTFPDTLVSGDTVRAEIFLNNNEWHIKKAYSYCPIGEDNVFRTFHRNDIECQEFVIRDNKVQIWFITLGNGPKNFDLVTLIVGNSRGQLKATELQLTYYLKEKSI